MLLFPCYSALPCWGLACVVSWLPLLVTNIFKLFSILFWIEWVNEITPESGIKFIWWHSVISWQCFTSSKYKMSWLPNHNWVLCFATMLAHTISKMKFLHFSWFSLQFASLINVRNRNLVSEVCYTGQCRCILTVLCYTDTKLECSIMGILTLDTPNWVPYYMYQHYDKMAQVQVSVPRWQTLLLSLYFGDIYHLKAMTKNTYVAL